LKGRSRTIAQRAVRSLSPFFTGKRAILRDGGFRDACLFYTAFTWHGRIGHA